MHKALLASVSAVALTCTAAMPAHAAPPTPSWTGFYAGLNAGYAWGNANPTLTGSVVTIFGFSGTTGAPPSLHPQGFIGGGLVGYNWQSGQFVYGGEFDFSGLSAKSDATLNPFFIGKGSNRNVTFSSQYDWLFTARVRGGYLVAPNWLVYATGGLAVTHVKDSVICRPITGSCGDFSSDPLGWSDSTTLAGGTIGGGFEYMFGPQWTARVEYLYAKFKDTTPPVTVVPVSNPGFIPAIFTFSHDLSIVRFAVAYKFSP